MAKADKQLGRYAVRHMETVYPELCKLFGYQPPRAPAGRDLQRGRGAGRSSVVQRADDRHALPGHGGRLHRRHGGDGLAQRRRRLGDGSIGPACSSTSSSHVITLQQTKFNIPHWYTEGLAVWCEGYPRPQTWNEMLLDRVPRGKLFNLQTLNGGFARPGSNEECQMAYCQAELYVEYMLTRGGQDRLRQMLAAYTDQPEPRRRPSARSSAFRRRSSSAATWPISSG